MRAIVLPLIAGALLAVPPVSSADITTGLVGYWPFSGDAQDASGNGNHGAPSATAQLTEDRFGNPNSAYAFDGASSRIDIPSSVSLASPTTELTMAAWIRRDGWGHVGSQYSPILTKSITTENAFQYRFVTSATGVGTALNSWNTSYTVPVVPAEGSWHHVVSTWGAGVVTVYMNGSLVGTGALATTIVADNRPLSIGSDTPGILEIFSGDLDEVRIYARALTADDVAELAGPVTSAPLPGAVVASIDLGRAFPNPATRSTLIPFTLSAASPVDMDVLDVAGRRVARLLTARPLAAGPHTVAWDARDSTGRPVIGGVYLYRLSTPQGAVAGKVLVRR